MAWAVTARTIALIAKYDVHALVALASATRRCTVSPTLGGAAATLADKAWPGSCSRRRSIVRKRRSTPPSSGGWNNDAAAAAAGGAGGAGGAGAAAVATDKELMMR